jgi:hydroxymethylpyrimidine pyrophosphatase-like HAD family hydrolase
MVWDSNEGHEIMALADGSRAKAAAQWLATQIDGFDPAGIESNRWRETEWCLFEKEDEDLMRELLADTEWSDLIVVPTGFAIHICAPGIDKAGGLRLALEQRGVKPERVIVCGDAPNDVSMFDLCGFSVAVNDARSSVVEGADCLTEARGTEGSLELLRAVIAIL